MRKSWSAIVGAGCLLVLAVALLGCGGSSQDNGTPVAVTEKDFSISLDQTNVAAGKVTFTIHNDGPSTHEFVVFKTDLSADKLPVQNDLVVEDDPSLQHIDEVEDIAPGSNKKLTVDLQPGHYALICNMLAHYEQGMHVDFTVN